MALAPDEKKRMGDRVAWLLDASGVTGTELAKRLGSPSDSLVTKLKAGESVTVERLKGVALALRGEGQLIEDHHELASFLLWGTDPRTVLRPHLWLVEAADSQPESVDSVDLKGGSTGPYHGEIAA